jgi:mycofactocin precursor peptide peptidase
MKPRRLADATWPEVPERPLVLVPVGSLEQHGPHLPFDTDTVIATAAAEALAARTAATSDLQVLLAPALVYGASGEHQGFPGTVSLGHEALRVVVVELVRSVSTWAERIVLVNGHGGNVATLRSAVAQMVDEGHNVSWLPCAFESATDAHAGYDETSVMLHLAPAGVRMDRAAAGNTSSLADLMPALVTSGVAVVSPSGVLGDPTGATAEDGRVLFEGLVDRLSSALLLGRTPGHEPRRRHVDPATGKTDGKD